jgi:hypothetical protein
MQLLFSLFLRMLSNARGSLSYPYLIGYEIPWFCTTSTVDRVRITKSRGFTLQY